MGPGSREGGALGERSFCITCRRRKMNKERGTGSVKAGSGSSSGGVPVF